MVEDLIITSRQSYTKCCLLDLGHSGVEKFTYLMNMPKSITWNNYDKLVTKIVNVTKTVAEKTRRFRPYSRKGLRAVTLSILMYFATVYDEKENFPH